MANFEPIQHVKYKSVASSSRQNALIDRVNFNTSKYEALTATGMGVAVVDTIADRDALSTFPGMVCYVLGTDTEYVFTSGKVWRTLGSASAVGVRLTLRNSLQNIPTTTDTVMQPDTAEYGPVGVTVSSGTVTVHESGVYSLSAGFRGNYGNTGSKQVSIGHGSTTVDGLYAMDQTAGLDVAAATDVPLQPGDKVHAFAWFETAGDIGPIDGRVPYLAVFKIGNL